MTIGIVALHCNHGHTGEERYVRNLVSSLVESQDANRRYRIFLSSDGDTDFGTLPFHVSITRIPGSRLSKALFQHFILPLLLRECDWTLFAGYAGSLMYPRSRSVLCVYDTVALARPYLGSPAAAAWRRRLAPHFLRKTRAVICPSVKVQADVVGMTQRTRGVVVSRLPVDPAFTRPAGHLSKDVKSEIPSGDFVLVVGLHEPRKNLSLVGEIATILSDRTFVLAGLGTASLGCKLRMKNVVGLGFVDQETLVALYQQCGAVMCPSLSEGYGSTVAEAISVGKPVVCFRIPPLTEFDHPLVHSVNEKTAASMAEALRTLPPAQSFPAPAASLPTWQEHVDEIVMAGERC